MLSRNLEKSLHNALSIATDAHHEHATLEHLLLALTDDQDALAVLRACDVDVDPERIGGIRELKTVEVRRVPLLRQLAGVEGLEGLPQRRRSAERRRLVRRAGRAARRSRWPPD